MTETPVVEMIRKGDMVVGVVAKHKGRLRTFVAGEGIYLRSPHFPLRPVKLRA